MIRSIIAISFLLISNSIHAQHIKDEVIVYNIYKLPLQPLPVNIRNYQAEIRMPYLAKNRELKASYQEAVQQAKVEYEKAMQQYPADLKAAEDKYNAEMEAYKSKSLGEKIIEKTVLNENTKPVKQIPAKPYLRQIPLPQLYTEYDSVVLASTYLQLGGYENLSQNAVKIIVTLYGYDYTLPRVLNNSKDMVSMGGGGTSTYKQTYYYTEYSYRHPMSVKVILPDGKEILSQIPQALNLYKIQRSGESTQYPSVNTELLVKTTEEKILHDNLLTIKNLINDKFGFAAVPRKATLYYVKDKDGLYGDLTMAFNEASTALKTLAADSSSALPNLQHAISLWEKALTESDPSDKKARIDKDVTIIVCFNLLEMYLATNNIAGGQTIIQRLNSLSLSNSERSIKSTYEFDFTDLKKRLNPVVTATTK
jgi:hypothetical protein